MRERGHISLQIDHAMVEMLRYLACFRVISHPGFPLQPARGG